MISTLDSDTALDKAFKDTDSVVLKPFGHQVSRQGNGERFNTCVDR